MKALEKKYINAVFITAFIILTALNIITYLNLRSHLSDESTINNILSKIQISEALMSNMNEAETSARGFYITKDESFLKQHFSAVNEADSLYLILKNEIKNNEKQASLFDTLGILLGNRKSIWIESINNQKTANVKLSEQAIFTSRGKFVQDQIRFLITTFQNEERAVLSKMLKESESNASDTLIGLFVGYVVLYILLITGVIILNKNISKRKQIEDSLWESRNWFETTLQSIGDGVIVTDKVGAIEFMNKVAEELTGWSESDAKGLLLDHAFNVVDEKTGKNLKDASFIPLKTGKVISGALLKPKTGFSIPIEFSASTLIYKNEKSLGNVYVFRDVSERRKSEKELLDSKRFIQRIADSIPSIIYSYSLKGPELKYINYKIVDYLGYTPDEALTHKIDFFKKLIHPEDLLRLASQYNTFLKANDSETINYEYRIKNSKEEWRIFRSYDVVFARAKDGSIMEMLGTAMDVTEEKKLQEEIKKYSGHLEDLVNARTNELIRANEKLKNEFEERARAEQFIIEAEEKFRSLVENSLVGIYIIQDEKFVYTNPKFDNIFGFGGNELTGTNVYERVHPNHRSEVADNINKRLNNEIETIQYGFKGLKKDGNEIYIEVRGTTMNYKGRLAVIGSMLDVTDQKQQEQALIEQEQFLKMVFDTTPGLIFVKDWNGKYTLANKILADLYGTTIDKLIGKRDADFNSNLDEIERFIDDDREVISTKKAKVISEEVVTNTLTQESRWYQTIKVPLVGKNGETQVLGISTDITERKIAEEITKKSLEEKELLLKEIHHRVKNNLQIIVSLLKMQSKYLKDSRDLEMFNDSRSRVETMSTIHERLYRTADLNNIDLGIYLTDLMNNILKFQKDDKRKIKVESKCDEVMIGIDTAIPCGLIVNELLLNILKYSFNNGNDNSLKLSLKKIDDKINIQLIDNGRGISAIQKTESADSLGFQLMEMLVKQIDGEMIITYDEGTHFYLSLQELIYKERI